MKSNRNLSRGDGRRLGNASLIAFMLGSLVLLSLIRARLSPIDKTGDAIKVDEQHGGGMAKGSIKMDVVRESPVSISTGDDEEEEEEEKQARPKPADKSSGGGVPVPVSTSRTPIPVAVPVVAVDRAGKPVCYESGRRSDTCEAAGDVRVLGRSQTIQVRPLDREWKVKPYCRKQDAFALSHVKEWTLRPLLPGGAAPHCTVNSTATAFVLSTGGFTGNLFHDYTDVLVPAFITAHRFGGEVQFLVSSYKSWWTNRYLQIFQQLSRHEVIDIDGDDEVRCYPSVVVGPTFHKELGVDASKTAGTSMADFRAMLRGAFGLERAAAEPSGDRWDIRRRPRLLIISRKGSRAFLNERAMADMAMSLGYDVRVGEQDTNTDVAKFARLVNSADVMVGVHGAGLTNMLFLPAGAVLIQVVPYGGLEWLARGTFEEPAKDMELHYIKYVIQLDETTLSEQYPKDHPVLTDPLSIHKQGWEALKTVYLEKQNVRPHLGRLKLTLLDALKLLPHGRQGQPKASN